MPQRNIIGPIVDAGGAGLPVGELQVTPVLPGGEASDGFVAKMRRYPISDGQVTAPVIVPGSYKLDIVSESGERLRAFTADIPATSLVDITLKELWDSRSEVIDISPLAMHEGDNILRLSPGSGVAGQMLSHADGHLVWRNPPRDGDMISSLYDPLRKQVNVFDRANHVGAQPVSSITGLAGALGLIEYARVGDVRAPGVSSGSCTPNTDTLRTFNTIHFNNSGLSDAELLDGSDSSIKLLPGRVYFGHGRATAGNVDAHFLTIKSTDGAVTIMGPPEQALNLSGPTIAIPAIVEFRIAVAANAPAMRIQLYQRFRFDGGDTSLGLPKYPGIFTEYASITILSRPI